MVKQGGERVLWCWLLVATWQYLPCVCLTPYTELVVEWKLYKGLKLPWNEASKFCYSVGGHLPVLDTKIRLNGFNKAVVQRRKMGFLFSDTWTGLYTSTRNEKPNILEMNCSLQLDGLLIGRDDEPNDLDKHFCVKYQQRNQQLCTWDCNTPYDIVCEFYKDDVNNSSGPNTSITNSSSIPQPAVDPFSADKTSSFTVNPKSTRHQMYTAASTQPQRSGEIITQTAREQSSSEPQTETTWLTTKISTQDNTEVNAVEPVGTSWTTQNSKRQSTEETATTSQSSETAVDNTRNTSTERLRSSTELSQYQTPTTSHVPEYSSSSEVNPSTKGPKPVLCPCIKSHPNVSTMLPIMPRNTTARYRRSHNSEWGSPSVYTFTSAAIFVIVVGVGGFLFVVCDINRSLSLSKSSPKRLNQPSVN